jgi:phosphomannomutase
MAACPAVPTPDADRVAAATSAARAWRAADPDPATRSELDALLAGDPAVLVARFAGRLQFGTAGLRGPLGAGPMRMNRVLVRRAAAGLAAYLLAAVPDAAARGVVIGHDARTNSDVFALDSARVFAAAGIRAFVLPPRVPTPVAAFAVTHLGAGAGVVVTASHNPASDHGYQVYLGDGAQLIAPADREIAAAIDATPLVPPLAADDDPLIVHTGAGPVEAYLAHVPSVRHVPSARAVRVAYTPMHGVGGATLRAAFERCGFPAPVVVPEQAEPDPAFPTVAFPNPEEPGAMDLVVALAARTGVDLVLANDPDADRLAVAVPTAAGGWRVLNGDEIGWLLADHLLRHTSGADRFVVTTVVSSTLLARMAADHGIEFAEVFTGFKWIARAIAERPGSRFVFGYEQALGYLVSPVPRDKDGITAAVVMAEAAAVAKAAGTTLEARLGALEERYGRHRLADRSVRMDPTAGAAAVAGMRAAPPASLGDRAVVAVRDFPEANLLRLELDGGVRVQVRPSGTEPKVKLYGEAVDEDPAPYLAALAELLGARAD